MCGCLTVGLPASSTVERKIWTGGQLKGLEGNLTSPPPNERNQGHGQVRLQKWSHISISFLTNQSQLWENIVVVDPFQFSLQWHVSLFRMMWVSRELLDWEVIWIYFQFQYGQQEKSFVKKSYGSQKFKKTRDLHHSLLCNTDLGYCFTQYNIFCTKLDSKCVKL